MLKINAELGEIFVYDTIGQDWFGEGITATHVIEALDKLKGKRASVRINSPGGVADEGIAIYNALKRYPGGVDTHNDSVAASAASIVFLAGETRTMARGARVMIHRAMTLDMGNATSLRKTADVLETYDKSLVDIYAEYMTGDDDILALMDSETWYTSQEAIDTGLATALVPVKACKANVANWFKKPPAALLAEISIDKRYWLEDAKSRALGKR